MGFLWDVLQSGQIGDLHDLVERLKARVAGLEEENAELRQQLQALQDAMEVLEHKLGGGN